MIKEVTNSFKAALYQRVSSPLYGTYIFSWLIYNWKIILPLVFGSQVVDERLIAFSEALSPADEGLKYATLLFPVLITIVILCCQPFFQRIIFIYIEWNKSEGLKKRDEFNSKTMLTLEQSNELRSSLNDAHSSHQKNLDNKKSEVSELNKVLDYKDKEIARINTLNQENVLGITSLNSQSTSDSKKIASLKVELELVKDSYSKLEITSSDLATKNSEEKISLNDDIAGLKRDLEHSKKFREQSVSSIRGLKGELIKAQVRNTNLSWKDKDI